MDQFIHLENLSIGIRRPEVEDIPIIREITLGVKPGETVGLVGESGSGKSTVALSMMGYMDEGLGLLSGHAYFDEISMFDASRSELENLRGGEICLVPQNAGQSLTPTMRIGRQIEETLALHTTMKSDARGRAVVDLLGQVRLPGPEEIAGRYPHELSGGQQQRCAIAMALAGQPRALLLDEPTTGLDVTTQVHILELLKELSRERGVAMVFVSHDLGAVARISDRIAVLYSGELIELGTSSGILNSPSHPYTRGLIASIPRIDGAQIPEALPGYPPGLSAVRRHCAFEPRCAYRESICASSSPPLNTLPDGRSVRCHFDTEKLKQVTVEHKPGICRDKTAAQTLLELNDIGISYSRPGFFEKMTGKAEKEKVLTVDDINFVLHRGETIAVVGESGSGKSTILRGIVGLVSPSRGSMTLEGSQPLDRGSENRPLECKKEVQMIFQNPDSALNPRKTIAEIISAPLQLYFGMDKQACRQKAAELLESVRLTKDYLDRCPDQLSGGEKQRVGIARAFAAEPKLALCDEVTSALDVSVQAAVLELLQKLQKEKGVAYLFVSHNLATVRAVADRVMVLYQGRICEIGPADSVFEPAFHPYTEALMGAVLEPDPDAQTGVEISDIAEKSPPRKGCPFQRRCQRKIGEICEQQQPPMQTLGGHTICCHISRERLTEMQKPAGG